MGLKMYSMYSWKINIIYQEGIKGGSPGAEFFFIAELKKTH